MPRRRKQLQHFGDVLGHAPAALRRNIRQHEPWLRWEDIVGPTVARHAQPAVWRRGILIVRTASHVWMQELHFMREDIAARIRQACPQTTFRGIRFELAAPNEIVTPEEDEPAPAPVELTAADRNFARKAAEHVDDPETRVAIRHLIEKDLALKKSRSSRTPRKG